MLRIIKADLYRISKEKSIKVILILIFLYTLFQIIPFNEILAKLGSLDLESPNVKYYGYNAFVNLNFAGAFNLIVPFLIVSIFSSELNKGTMDSFIVSKLQRKEIFMGKYISFSILIIGIMIFSAVFTSIIFTVINGWGTIKIFESLLNLVFLATKFSLFQISYASITILLSLYINNSALVVIVYFGSSIVESIFASIIQVITSNNKSISGLTYIFPSNYSNLLSTNETSYFLGAMISIFFYILITIIIGSIVFPKRR